MYFKLNLDLRQTWKVKTQGKNIFFLGRDYEQTFFANLFSLNISSKPRKYGFSSPPKKLFPRPLRGSYGPLKFSSYYPRYYLISWATVYGCFSFCSSLDLSLFVWKCNFPMNHNVCLSVYLSVGLSVSLSFGLSVHQTNFLNVRFFGKCRLLLLLLKNIYGK